MTAPVVARTRAELADLLAPDRTAGRRIALVPTMGALHEGHASLIREARRRAGDGPVVVSIFVNPTQFGPGEDLDRYPRTFDADLEMCGAEGATIVFAPAVDEVYPGAARTGSVDPVVTVDPGPLGSRLEGSVRPTHFRGVLTVVAKLFGLVRPDLAVFGQKDYQQLVLVRQLSADLCLGVEVVGAETVREPDGLALSSRNRYLDGAQRQVAATLNRALRAAQAAADSGVDAARVAALAVLEAEPAVELDYLALTSVDLGVPPLTGEGRALVAARVGTTRLLDNLPVHLGSPHRVRPAEPVVTVPMSEASL